MKVDFQRNCEGLLGTSQGEGNKILMQGKYQ
jgi:hypothetical protein